MRSLHVMSTIRFVVAVLFLSVLGLGGCSDETFEKFEEAKELYDKFAGLKTAIDTFLPEGEANFSFQNGKVLVVSLVNALVEDASEAQRKALSDKVVAGVEKYRQEEQMFPHLELIVVTYVQHEKKYLIVDYTVQIARYRYPVSQNGKA